MDRQLIHESRCTGPLHNMVWHIHLEASEPTLPWPTASHLVGSFPKNLPACVRKCTRELPAGGTGASASCEPAAVCRACTVFWCSLLSPTSRTTGSCNTWPTSCAHKAGIMQPILANNRGNAKAVRNVVAIVHTHTRS